MGCLSSWSCPCVVMSASSCCLPFLSWRSISGSTGQSDSMEPELLQQVWLTECVEQTPGTCSGLLVNFYLLLELKNTGFFFFFFKKNKACTIPEWLQSGVTQNGSGIRNLGLLWMCSLVGEGGWDRPDNLQDPCQLWLIWANYVQTDLMQEWKQRADYVFLLLTVILPPWKRHSVTFP